MTLRTRSADSRRTMNSYLYKAYGKINLGLDVTGKLENGYHLVSMIMQTVGLYDKLTFTPTQKPGITMKTNLKFLPVNENNLVVKAARLMFEKYGISTGLHIELEKHIPVSAGMAGGSSDAATTLIAVNEIYKLNASKSELMEIGTALGADVPYCIMGGTAHATGIGEKLEPVEKLPDCSILLVKPGMGVSTPEVYRKLDAIEAPVHPDIEGLISSLSKGDIKEICAKLGNILEEVTIKQYPEIADIKQNLMDEGACGALMSGSGPTVFAIFDDEKKAKRAFYKFKISRYGRSTFFTAPVSNIH